MSHRETPSLPAALAGAIAGDGFGDIDVSAACEQESVANREYPEVLRLSRVRIPRPLKTSLPDLDHELIANCLHLEDGEPAVAVHHRSMFYSWHAAEIEQAAQGRDLVRHHISRLEARMRMLSTRALRTDELVKQERAASEPGIAWDGLDLAAAIGLGLFSLVLLGMGVNTLATYLLDSGFIIFVERPALAYLFSAINAAMAVMLKVGFSWCRDDVTRHRYFLWLWGLGLASGGLWLVTFALIFPNIGTQGIDEIIASVGEERALRESFLEAVFVCAQLVSEICISAAVWIHLERLMRVHAPAVVMAVNPEHSGYLRRLAQCSEAMRAAVETRSALDGWLKALDARESAYLAKAVAAFKAGRASRQAGRYGLATSSAAAGWRQVENEDGS